MIITHQNVDLDAAISVACECILQKLPITDDTVRFVKANCMDLDESDTWIDLQIEKHEDNHAHLWKYKEYLPYELIIEVDTQDCYGFDPGTLQLVLEGLKKNNYSDIEKCQFFEPLVKGWMKLANDRKDAKPSYERLPKVEFKVRSGKSYKFVIEEFDRMKDDGSFYAEQDGCVGKFYLSRYNMGMVIYPQFGLDLRKVPPLVGWFQNKFMYVWGSYKAPRESFPPQFKNLTSFIKWMEQKFLDYNVEMEVLK